MLEGFLEMWMPAYPLLPSALVPGWSVGTRWGLERMEGRRGPPRKTWHLRFYGQRERRPKSLAISLSRSYAENLPNWINMTAARWLRRGISIELRCRICR